MRGAGAPKARAWGAAAVAAVVAAGALTALGAAGAAAPGGGPEGGGGGALRYKELQGGPEGFDAALQGPPAPRGVTVALLGPGEW